MLLRESGRHDGLEHDYSAINGTNLEQATVADAAHLNAFAEAYVAGDRYALSTARQALAGRLGAAALVDCAATVAIFDAVVRIADATGIPLEPYKVEGAADLRAELGIDDYR